MQLIHTYHFPLSFIRSVTRGKCGKFCVTMQPQQQPMPTRMPSRQASQVCKERKYSPNCYRELEMARISLAFVGKCQFIKMKAIFRQRSWLGADVWKCWNKLFWLIKLNLTVSLWTAFKRKIHTRSYVIQQHVLCLTLMLFRVTCPTLFKCNPSFWS